MNPDDGHASDKNNQKNRVCDHMGRLEPWKMLLKNLPEVSWGVLLSILNPENRFPLKSQMLFFLSSQ